METNLRDDRKTASVVHQRAKPRANSRSVTSYTKAREILRNKELVQAGGGAEFFDTSDPASTPVFFLDGPDHKKKRADIAKFFTPKAIKTRYTAIINEVTKEQIDQLRQSGEGRIDLMSFDLAVAVAADIVGLTVTDRQKMAKRLSTSLAAAIYHKFDFASRFIVNTRKFFNQIDFYWNDVRPTIRARRAEPQDDIISHLIAAGLSDRAIMMECMTYAAAGMVTTREFIVVAAWHMFENETLRQRFVSGDEKEQEAILLEILRLEPIAAFLYRRQEDKASEVLAICSHQVNTDPDAVGECPFALDPDRATKIKGRGEFLSFGDGAHHCPGWQIALHETRMFLSALMIVPGIALHRVPDIGWSEMLQSYELRNAVVTCQRKS
ncbi:cytochrome P450 [Pontixanthobacter aquaemixtae]|uniref:Cytochrome P450 n=1 Tax=Pontixanthobacter aquaemixtae TaxID=1958940 RepID=A0A844ZSF7_9SPHN|nr:cytochrome P450 [Pontixanthobacter aquaemixtae]MXO89936.1 cytochrome P450 [Pontixanthobacter aquaemixtae]